MGEGFFGYYGNYSFDEARSMVTHHLEMSSDPAFVGSSNVRHAQLDGPRLTLAGSFRTGGDERPIRVVWEREAG